MRSGWLKSASRRPIWTESLDLRDELENEVRIGIFNLTMLVCVLFLAACSSDDAEDDDAGSGSEESAEQAENPVAAESFTEATAPPQPEQSVPALIASNEEDITVGGFIFESSDGFLLCEAASEDDPPECEGDTLEISNGDVIDTSIFLGEPGARYSDAEVVVTGDVSDGVLTIG